MKAVAPKANRKLHGFAETFLEKRRKDVVRAWPIIDKKHPIWVF